MIENYFRLENIAYTTGASQDGFELHQLLVLMQATGNTEVVLEIGVDTGRLMKVWKDAFGAKVVGVDIATERFDYSTNMFDQLIVGDSGASETVCRVEEMLDGDLVSLLFVDGDHTLEATLRDVEMYKHLVDDGGIIAVHDTSRTPGMYAGVETRAAFDLLRRGMPSIEISNGPAGVQGPGIGVLFV